MLPVILIRRSPERQSSDTMEDGDVLAPVD